jgi:membrane dipeptidase
MDRRTFQKLAALGIVPPLMGFEFFSSAYTNNTLYDNAIVIDGLIIGRNWDDDSFAALEKTGYTGFNVSLDSATLNRSLKSLVDWKQRVDNHPDTLIHATAATDFERAKKENKVAVLFGFQNSRMIQNDLGNLDILYQAGTRWMQLTYNERNLLGDGCTERTNAGLSDFGIEAVERMNELGIIIDLSHCGRQTTDDGIAFSKTGAMINHSMCEALHKNHPRAKTDAQIKAMADKGGVLGIICLGYMIGPKLGVETTLETYVDHIDHAVKVGGIDHVGLAADYPIEGLEASGATKENWYTPRLTRFKPSYKVQWPPWIPELDTTDRYRHVTRLLEKRGYGTGDIEKILGGNFLRYYREVLKS